jgi:serine/threonine protein kinase/class 3 adenylate cyclase
MHPADDINALLKARARIDEQLRRHKNAMTVLFTDVVGSTSFFERNGDTAGLVMIHHHDELAARAIQQHEGKVVKTIGDSAMAEFPDPGSAVRAAVEIERQFLKFNLTLPEGQRVQVRIGIHTGIGFRKGSDLFGDVVNVAARIVKRTSPAQILISRPMYEAVSKESDLFCRWLSKLTIDGRTEKEDIFEVVWTDAEAYKEVQEKLASSSQIPPRYEVLSQIGTGGSGMIYKVRDLETGEIVALKVLKPEAASNPDVQENFKRELCLSRKITHKNVCRIHEFNRMNATVYTSMEFVEGESLLSRLYREGSLPLDDALEIARQICAGLREAHAQGIVHRDLKPANIMIGRNNTVKIMDFGIARMIQRDGPLTGTIVGTPSYMAPEQAELKPVSSCTDIYAVGLLLYEMITGVAAFSGDTPVAVALKQIQEYPKRPREIAPQLSGAMDAVIMKCLQKSPTKRFQSAEQLDFALMKASKARPLSPLEASVNRWVMHAELAMRTHLRQGVEKVKTFLMRQDWRALPGIQKEPTAMLGVAGMVGAVAVFLLFGGWKPAAINAQTVPVSTQNSVSPVALANGASSEFPSSSSGNSLDPIASHEVDLYGRSKAGEWKISSFDAELPDGNLPSERAAPPAASPKTSRTAKRAITPFHTDKRKAYSDAHGSTQLQTFASPIQPEILTPIDFTVSPEAAINLSQPNIAPEPTLVSANPLSLPKASGNESKTPDLYLEVGAFKDETWADQAADKLTQLGFHAVLIHKNLWWAQSYHVEVGPYSNQKDINVARQSLASHGFKAHAVN